MAEVALRHGIAWPQVAWLAPQPPRTRLLFRGDAGARASASAAFGVTFPEQACRAAGLNDARAVLWLGPDEWLLLAPRDGGSSIQSALADALRLQPHSLVDVSHRQVAFELQGRRAAWLLEAQCPLPLNLRDFPVGMCTRTVFAKTEIVLWRVAEYRFHVEVGRSFAQYLVGLLQQVATESDHA
jgi:sarcosine oxidase subunit gamma